MPHAAQQRLTCLVTLTGHVIPKFKHAEAKGPTNTGLGAAAPPGGSRALPHGRSRSDAGVFSGGHTGSPRDGHGARCQASATHVCVCLPFPVLRWPRTTAWAALRLVLSRFRFRFRSGRPVPRREALRQGPSWPLRLRRSRGRVGQAVSRRPQALLSPDVFPVCLRVFRTALSALPRTPVVLNLGPTPA